MFVNILAEHVLFFPGFEDIQMSVRNYGILEKIQRAQYSIIQQICVCLSFLDQHMERIPPVKISTGSTNSPAVSD